MEFKNGREFFREPVGKEQFSMAVSGDCCPWESAIETIRNGGAADIVAAVKPFIDDADVKVIQFETPLTNDGDPIDKSGPNLECPPECLDLILAGGFDVALLSNNHTGDQGPDAVMETIKRLNDAGIKTVGAGKDLAASKLPLEMECNGISVAILNFAENEFGSAGRDKPGCAPLDPLDNIKSIKAAALNADLAFVIIHGGHERNPMPSPRMVETYRAFADAGAAMVMNIHTHCPEGIEVWNGVPIIYSPGNFFFPWPDLTSKHLNPLWWVGYLPKFHCDCEGVYGLEIMPCRFDNERIHALAAAENEAFFAYLAELSRLILDPEELRLYFEGWVAKFGGNFLIMMKERLAAWPIDLEQREAVRELLPCRNCFTCESHNDLIKNYLRMIEEKRIPQALEYWPKIEQFQNPAWATHYWEKLRGK